MNARLRVLIEIDKKNGTTERGVSLGRCGEVLLGLVLQRGKHVLYILKELLAKLTLG